MKRGRSGVTELRLSLKAIEGEVTLGILGGPNVITGVLTGEKQEGQRGRRRDVTTEAGVLVRGRSRRRGRGHEPRSAAAPDAAKGNGMEPPLEPPEGTQPCPPQISAPCN